MIDERELFERASLRFDPPQGGLERLLRRRDRKRRNQRIGAGALAIIIAIVSFAALTRAFNTTERPADPTPTPTDTTLRRNGEVIKSTGDRPLARDLVAQDPVTGEVRTLVDAHDVSGRVGSAAWSTDGRWLAFEILGCSPYIQTAGLWVKNAGGESLQLTKCEDAAEAWGVWAWSLVGAQLVVELPSADGDALVLIDPATGERTDLGEAVGDVTSLTWSPDGTRIAYASLPRSGSSISRRGSVYSVRVDGGEHSLLASSVGYVYGIGSNIRWSPDGAHVLIHASQLYLMNADGSDLHPVVEDAWGMAWSPDGTRFAYATISEGPQEEQLQIWTQRPDGSTPSLIFESAPAPLKGGGSPVWSPDGTQIAFSEYSTRWKAIWLVTNADGTGDAHEIDELRYESWGGGSYFCGCYG